MSLAMDLATLCDIWRWNGTNECHLAVFSEEVALAHHFMATRPPPTLPPCRSAGGISYISKNCLKWQAIQLAIH